MQFKLDLVEKPAETQTSIRLASHLLYLERLTHELGARSEGHEFESSMRQEIGALTKSGKTIWGQVFLQW
jgi:hypothetical protein